MLEHCTTVGDFATEKLFDEGRVVENKTECTIGCGPLP